MTNSLPKSVYPKQTTPTVGSLYVQRIDDETVRVVHYDAKGEFIEARTAYDHAPFAALCIFNPNAKREEVQIRADWPFLRPTRKLLKDRLAAVIEFKPRQDDLDPTGEDADEDADEDRG